jgi:hypothetical protein
MPKTTSLEYACYALQLYSPGLSLKDIVTMLIFINQKKPYISLELDSKAQAKEGIEKERESH